MLEKAIHNLEFFFFFFFRTIFSFNSYYCTHSIAYDFKSPNVDFFFFPTDEMWVVFWVDYRI